MKNVGHRFLLPVSLGALLLTSACSSSSDDPPPPPPTIAASLAPLGLNTLLAAAQQAGLVDELSTGSLTLFAPTDAAFAALPDGLLAGLTDQQLAEILLYHVINTGPVPSQVAVTLDEALMSNGDCTLLDVVGGILHVNDARVIQADIGAANGIIHIIDRVLLPPQPIVDTLATLGGFETLLAALEAVDPPEEGAKELFVTLLAPTDAAFEMLPKGFLEDLTLEELTALIEYHAVVDTERIVASEGLMRELVVTLLGAPALFGQTDKGLNVNGAMISRLNIKTEEGVIHVLDAVLTPPDTFSGVLGDLTGFALIQEALNSTGLDMLLDDPKMGPFTLFAPTDKAFAELEPAVLAALFDPMNEAFLNEVLQYHIVETPLTANVVAASGPTGIETLQGSFLAVSVTDEGGVVLDDIANVLTGNILTSNGIIHVIDGVLIPPGVVIP